MCFNSRGGCPLCVDTFIGVTITMSPHSGCCRQSVVKVAGPKLEDGTSSQSVRKKTNRKELMAVDELGKGLTIVCVGCSITEDDVSVDVSVVDEDVSVVDVDVSKVVSVDISEEVEVDVSKVVSVVLGVAVVVDCSVVVSEVVVGTSEGVGRGLIEVSDVEVSKEEVEISKEDVEVSKEDVKEDGSTEEVKEGISSEVVTEERVLDGPGRGLLVLVASALGVGLAKARVHGLPSGPCGPSMG